MLPLAVCCPPLALTVEQTFYASVPKQGSTKLPISEDLSAICGKASGTGRYAKGTAAFTTSRRFGIRFSTRGEIVVTSEERQEFWREVAEGLEGALSRLPCDDPDRLMVLEFWQASRSLARERTLQAA